ncbi:MAG: FliM/FliN family flagellar motor C-terminal domain-containing protein, partial [Candidatus Eremiobacteraeota bacterium]|nr:FliM/FliN family flagellar motor C-terminal domain-containing protein [Candidatus Eremiobacteraeota bacterium]
VCGLRDGSAPTRCSELCDYTTYFEVVFESPFQAVLGIALSRDPVERTSRTLAFSDLLDVEIEVAAQFCRGSMTSDALLRLQPGTLVPTNTKVGSLGYLTVGGAAVAQGDCGSIEQRNAFIFAKTSKGEQ